MIALENITIRQGAFALQNICFSVPPCSYAVLMGRTGCGKTTLLETICGLRPIASGRILLANRDVTCEPPAARNIGYVPQDAAIFTTMTVRENLSFALTVRHWNAEQINARVEELASLLGISFILDRSARKLSGGEAQRVALGRALAFNPHVLLLDEPLSALDEETRNDMAALLKSVRERTGVTTLHITHNREDAVRLADIVFILREGAIIQE